MTDKDFARPKPEETDRFKLSYKLTEGERIFAFFYVRITAFLAVSGLIYWALQIATR